MKIAIPTNDKESVFPRTGQAHGYMIYHVEDNHIKGKFSVPMPFGICVSEKFSCTMLDNCIVTPWYYFWLYKL